MDSSGNWFVLVEESAGNDGDFSVSRTVGVDGDRETAWESALEIARSHDRPHWGASYTREIYRVTDDSLRIVFKGAAGTVFGHFRVSIGQLIEVREPESPDVDDESARRKRWGRGRGN